MVGEGHRDTVGEFGARQGRGGVEADGAGAFECEGASVAVAPLVDERGGAMDEEADCAGLGGFPAEADRGAGFCRFGQEGGLAPFQGFGERAGAWRGAGGVKDQRTEGFEAGARV